jgi:hypothetical protein
MTPADAAAMADPDRNPHFRRRWVEEPGRRIRPAPAPRSPIDDVLAELSADLRSARLVRPAGKAPGLGERDP